MLATEVFYAPVVALIAYFVITSVIANNRHRAFAKANNCGPCPQLKQTWWLFGFDVPRKMITWMKTGKLMSNIDRMFSEVGERTFTFWIAGEKRIWTYEPENIRAILHKAEDYDISESRMQSWRPVLGNAVTTSIGDTWAHGRALVRPAFNKSDISDLSVLETHFQDLKKHINGDGTTTTMLPILHGLSMDVITAVLFGESIYSLRSDKHKEIEVAFDVANSGVVTRIFMGSLVRFYYNPEFYKACKMVHGYAEKYVRRAISIKHRPAAEQPKQTYEFMSELVKQTEDVKIIRDQILGSLSAGRNTSASFMSLLVYLLARNPDKQAILRKELESLNGVPPTYDQLRSLVYLRWVVDETFRMLPTLPIGERCAQRDTVLPTGGGPDGKSPIFVPKGTQMGLMYYKMHLDEEWWGKDAAEFKPERWKNYLKSSGKFVNFGGGPRTCPGQNLAITESGYMIVRMLQTFSKLETRDPGPFQEHFTISLHSATGTQVAFTQ